MNNRRKLVLLPLTALTMLLALASVAWACTTIAGHTNVTVTSTGNSCSSGPSTPTSCTAQAGAAITVSGTQAVAKYQAGSGSDIRYYVHFLNEKSLSDGHSCMGNLGGDKRISSSSTGTLVTSVASNLGTIASTPAQIPTNARKTGALLGPSVVCFVSGNASGADYAYGTNGAEVAII